MSELKVTPVAKLAEYANGLVVELPPFNEGQPFVVRLRRPSLLALAKFGKIPNELLNTATGLFDGSSKDKKVDADFMSQLYGVIDVLCEASFVEPTYSEIKKTGLELTDEQMIAIFRFTQQGVQALAPFRSDKQSNRAD
jgi:hypothetical protein